MLGLSGMNVSFVEPDLAGWGHCVLRAASLPTFQNQNESNQWPVNMMGQPTIGARVRESSTQRNDKHAFPRVPVTSKGAKFESNRRKTKSLHDLAKSNFQVPHQLELTTASLEPSQKEQKRTEQTEKIRRSIKHNQDQKSVEKPKEACCTANVC
jgi:hypothetical protein